MKHIFIFLVLSIFFSFQNFETKNFLQKNKMEEPSMAFVGNKKIQMLDSTDKILKEISHRVTDFYKKIPPEKIYVHLDKPFYTPKETIWGKVYLLNANTYLHSTISDVAYVEIINPKGETEKTIQLFMKDGVANFDFDLGETGGMYKLKAYTKWLLNDGQESVFERNIQVQKIMNPKLLLKIDFLQKSYGAGSQVEAYLEAMDLKKNKIANHSIDFSVNLAGKNFLQQTATTDQEGKTIITFKLPNELNSNDGLLNVIVNYDGYSESISRSIPIVLNKIDLQFMPEGGEAIANIDHKIAFKAINEFGKGADIEGFIVDELGNEITKFKSFHQGMGSFILHQAENKTYFAQVTSPFFTKIPLPKAKKEGYALMIDTLKNKVLEGKIYAPFAKNVYLTAQSGGKIFFSAKINAQKGMNFFKFDTRKENIGIAQITLFNENKQPQAERLVFLNVDKKLKIKIKTDKNQYLPREKVNVNIKTTDENDLPIKANLSLSAVNEQILNVADDKQDDILSWMLLGSELKGKIDEPNFYFNPKEKKATAALDFLMLTQGWRKFSWKKAQNKTQYVKYIPEKNSTISGIVVNQEGKPIEKAQVVLFETGNNIKGVINYTDKNGRFVFLRTNPAMPMQMMVKPDKERYNCRVLLDKAEQYSIYQHYKYAYNYSDNDPFFSNVVTTKNKSIQIAEKVDLNDKISLQEDNASLSEVVVTGYAEKETNNLTQSVRIVNGEEVYGTSIDQLLQGRVSGVIINQGQPIATNVKIRGSSSFSNNAPPLYILDGTPITAEYFATINPDNIVSVEILKDAAATAVFGSRGANGVIIIQGKKTLKHDNKPLAEPLSPYTSLFIENVAQNSTREFYVPKYEKLTKNEKRDDFRTTIFWQNNINTNENGEANISFYNSDEITTFKLTAEGFGNGLIGRGEESYFTLKPLQADIEIPPFLTVEDTLKIPVYLRNNINEEVKALLEIETSTQNLMLMTKNKQEITLKPNEKTKILLPIIAKNPAKNQSIRIKLTSDFLNDDVIKMIDIESKGFPVEVSFSGMENSEFQFDLPKYLNNSLESKMIIYTDITQDFMNAVEGIIREPYGCFEQVSSTTYPNILALQLMNETGTIKPSIKKTALEYIKSGYKKLAGYEVRGGGFDWYGKAPANEELTAFGLVEFLDMQKVYDGVDNKMIERTKKWLLSRKDGKGGFLNAREYDRYPKTKNAYIVYALARAGVKDIELEYQTNFEKALKNEDAYQMALLASASLDLGKTKNATILLDKLRLQLQNINQMKVQDTWTNSGGISKSIEAVSFTGVSFIKNKEKNIKQLSDIVQFLNKNRSYGMFGSTQGTVTALQYLTDYVKLTKTKISNGQIELWNNDELLKTGTINPENLEVLELKDWTQKLKIGKNKLKVKFKNIEKGVPFSIQIKYNSYTPNSQKECAVDLQTHLSLTNIKVNETVRLTTSITNRFNENIPMTLAYVGIPSGLNVQAWQLKELQEKGVFDFYELRQNYVVFYYRSLQPKEQKVIHLDLTAKIPGTFLAPAGAAYLYYTKELKDWEEGEKITIQMP